MIRFCQKHIKQIDELQIGDIQNTDFFNEYKNEGVLVVNKSGLMRGIITFDNYTKNVEENLQIQEEKVFFDDSIFYQAHLLFDKNKMLVLLPVIYKGKIIAFCYDNKKKSYLYYRIDQILTYFEQENKFLSLQMLYPWVRRIRIIGFNEWTYRLYEIIKKQKMPVVVEGKLWKYIGIVSNNDIGVDSELFTVHGEGVSGFHQPDVYKEFDVLRQLACIHKLDLEYQIKSEYFGRFNNFYICLVSTFQDLNVKSLEEKIRNKLGITPISELSNGFFDEVFSDQFKQVSGMIPDQWLEKKKEDEKNFNAITQSVNGISVLKMGSGKNNIYLIGPCIVSCMGVMVNESLMAQVYLNIEKAKLDYSVIAIPCESWNITYLSKCLKSISIRSNDFVFIIEQNINICNRLWESDIDLQRVFDGRKKQVWFYDEPIHTNKYGNRAIADYLYHDVIQKEEHLFSEDFVIQKGELLDEESRINVGNYICEIKRQINDIPENAEIGAIVMNCNPFTLGHRYLVEYALSKVEYLYIFVLKEDRSFFPFADRYRIVQECTKDLKKVKVFSSGDFIISLHTFPAYFRKESYQDIFADCCRDAQIFADYIVPALKINARFVGEEPVDETTQKYNRILHSTLESVGVSVYEIPRIGTEEGEISASKVRTYYMNNEWEKLKTMVPQYVYEYLVNRKGE